ncbi:PKD domain-containing protein [candidate division KSB1 bacterium]|nr:PKD domain-containing protein [candidate division KSB1 bacterium]
MKKLVPFFVLSLFLISGCNKEKEENTSEITCKIISPAEGTEFIKGNPFEIVVNATGERKLSSVKIVINNNLYETLTDEPYVLNWSSANEKIGPCIIKAVATNDISETETDEITVTLLEGEIPTPLFEADTMSSSEPPLTVTFTNNSINYPTEWLWDFGDGNTSTSKSPTHTYDSYGTFSVSLTVTNCYGTKTKFQEDYIKIVSPGNIGDPCPNFEIIYYDGKEYSTVLIGDQCWMAENLNVGEMINGTANMSDNNIIEKYCLQNSEEECETYGGLYQWNELMNYSDNNQGICPAGWHIPTDEEWKILEGFADSQYGYPDPVWDTTDWRGLDAGRSLKTKTGWYQSPIPSFGTDTLHFSALPGGFRKFPTGLFQSAGPLGYFWTSSKYDENTAWGRMLSSSQYTIENNHKVTRYEYIQHYGLSVRCLKD